MRRPNRKLWGGRFSRPTALPIERFTQSLRVDQRLGGCDLRASIAHARMLGKTKIIPARISRRLAKALTGMLRDFKRGKMRLDPSAEDIHTAIQLELEKRAGEAAQYLHTARSRNDQVVTDLRLYCKEALERVDDQILRLQRKILDQAGRAGAQIIPGYTHLQHAQPMLGAHLFLGYLEALERDRQRLRAARGRVDELPLGSGALTGTGLPIDRKLVAGLLGFSRVSENSVDAVTERDFAAEILSDLGILGLHLSRIAEDLILFATHEFGFIRFDERLLTGSSMMPQKQNPDFLELTRAGTSRIIGNLMQLFTLLKGLPSGYQRDLQLDKECLFEGLDRAQGMLDTLSLGFGAIHWNPKAALRQLSDEALYATDLAEYLVLKGVPFALAHRAVGQLLAHAEGRGISLASLPLKEFRRFSPAFEQGVYALLNPSASIRRKRSLGSTGPARVRACLLRWQKKLH